MSAAAKRYATAIFELAQESNEVEAFSKSFGEWCASLNESRELNELFSAAVVGVEERAAVVDALAKQGSWSSLVTRSLKFISERGRVAESAEIFAAFEQLRRDAAGVTRAEVITAAPVADAYLAELKSTLEKVSGFSLRIEHSVDESLIGGVVAKVGDRVFDGSIKSRLSNMREQLSSSEATA